MKLAVFDTPKDQEVQLKLVTTYRGVEVHAVDNKGDRLSRGTLLTFDNDGTVELMGSVDTTLGFQLDERNAIKLNRRF